MARKALLFALLCLGLATICFADENQAEVTEDTAPKMSQEDLEAELSKIKDEVQKLRVEHDEVFANGDKDKDGQLSPEEFYAVQREDDPSLQQQELEEAFADHDTDASGFLSLPEWQQPFEDTVQQMMRTSELDESEEERIAQQREEFYQYDTNQDQVLDLAELEVLAKRVMEEGEVDQPLTGKEVLEALDQDLDGKVTFEEYVLDSYGQDYGGEYGGDMYGGDMYGGEDMPEGMEELDDLSLDDIAGDGELEMQ